MNKEIKLPKITEEHIKKITELKEAIELSKKFEANFPIANRIMEIKRKEENNPLLNEFEKNSNFRHFLIGSIYQAFGVKEVK
jgi:hypothetical protein